MLDDSLASTSNAVSRKLRLGFIGGGLNSAVGYTHFVATRLDGLFDVVAGCFSRHQEINQETAQRFSVPQNRCYQSAAEMLSAEVGRLDAVCILTPTPHHAEMISAVLKAGFHVICEKAMVTSNAEAGEVLAAVEASGQQLFVTFNYAGYPMVREAKAIIASGQLGAVQQVYCEMPTEGFARVEANPQDWRRQDYDIPCVSLDLGVHVHQMVHYLLGGRSCDNFTSWEASFGKVPGVIDTVSMTGVYQGPVLVDLKWGKAALGAANGLKFRIFAEHGSLEWSQFDPELLKIADSNGTTQVLERGQQNLQIANEGRYNRFKAGHPAGFIEAFANIYTDFHAALVGSDGSARESFGVHVATSGIELLSQIHAAATRCN
jgi:predicted dehydrogenase